MITTRIALRIALNEQNRQTLEFSRNPDKVRTARRRAHLRRQATMLNYALLTAVNEPKCPSLRASVAVLNHCAGIDHRIPEVIDAIAQNEGSRAGLHARHRAFRDNAEQAIARYADFLLEVQHTHDNVIDADVDLEVSRLLQASFN